MSIFSSSPLATPRLVIAVFLLSLANHAFPDTAILYPGADDYPSIFRDAELFSDHDEDAASKTVAGLSKAPSVSPTMEEVSVLHLDFDVQKSPVLPYQYAGVAFGFSPPADLDLTGTVRITVRSSEAIMLLPDAADSVKTKRALEPVSLPAMKWTVITMPAKEFDHLLHKEIDHVSVSIMEPAKGFLEIYSVEVPLVTSVGPTPGPPLSKAAVPAGGSGPPLLVSAAIFTDSGETPASKTTASLQSAVPSASDKGKDSFVSLQFNVAPNPALGYQYAGVEFSISPAADLKGVKELTFVVRSSVDIATAEAIILDQNRRKAKLVLSPITRGDWQTIKVPMMAAQTINLSQVCYLSLAITSATSGRLDIQRLNFSLAPAFVDSIQKAPAIAGSIQWNYNLKEAIARGNMDGKLIFLLACDEPRRAAAESILANKDISDLLQNYHCHRFDPMQNKNLQGFFKIFRMPTYLVYTANGEELMRVTGSADEATLLGKLQQMKK
ncbi:hypothetical protein BH09SUM1_BH09SUM1_03410 [soil metagenome]